MLQTNLSTPSSEIGQNEDSPQPLTSQDRLFFQSRAILYGTLGLLSGALFSMNFSHTPSEEFALHDKATNELRADRQSYLGKKDPGLADMNRNLTEALAALEPYARELENRRTLAHVSETEASRFNQHRFEEALLRFERGIDGMGGKPHPDLNISINPNGRK